MIASSVMNAMAKKESGEPFEPADFFPHLPARSMPGTDALLRDLQGMGAQREEG